MTDDRSIRPGRRDRSPVDGELVRRSLRALVAHQAPAADAWTDIRRRVEAGETGIVVTGGSPAAKRPMARRALAAAAVVIALVGGLVATRLATSDDQGVSVSTDSPIEPNGWYLPVGLPEGWHPLTVEVRLSPDVCPCRDAIWADASGARSVELISRGTLDVDDTLDNSPGQAVDLGPGVEAKLESAAPPESEVSHGLIWEADGRRVLLGTTGLTDEQTLEIGRALVTDPLAMELPIDGVEAEADRRGQALLDEEAGVTVTYRAPSGHRVDYGIRLSDSQVINAPGAERYEATRLEGQPMPVLRGEPYRFIGYDYTQYIGQWPGAMTSSNGGVGVLRDGSPNVTPEESDTLFAALRPVTTAEWRDMIAEAEDPTDGGPPEAALRTAPTLTDLLTG